jgi:hypothetical protein
MERKEQGHLVLEALQIMIAVGQAPICFLIALVD